MATAARSTKYRRQSDTELSRMEIMEGAALCFEARGYAATSLDEVAARISSTKGRIYHHYGSKAELFLDVYRTGMMMNFQAIEPLLDIDMPAIERLKAVLKAHVRCVIRTKAFQNVVGQGVDMLRHGTMPANEHAELAQLAELRDAYSEHFSKVLEDARAAGAIDYTNIKIALNSVFMCINGPIVWFTPRKGQPEHEIEALADECVLYAIRLLGHRGEMS
ncbi:TetR/AcrR family transcriptional regulator [uncultured Hoeflea sp.]|uniref:TetR/AcrR family transcriptional regulator n=1 Tax=uncultured Hoeflea sp. TaxID=538666 RepID=UPI0030EB9FA3|tara:strand:- start:19240 stop:19899 length:660 start_codon:yes stop_codon:yes gene_type:complete